MAPTRGVTITATWDSRDVKAALRALAPRQWRFATALAITRTAVEVKAAEVAEMQRVFDRPTPWTLNGLFLQKATIERQEARVWFKDTALKNGTPAGRYLIPEVAGGPRDHKRFERALQHAGLLSASSTLVPAVGAPRDQYGNVPGRFYLQILAQLRTNTANGKQRRARRVTAVSGLDVFYGNPGGHGRGVWERVGGPVPGFARRHVRPLFLQQRGTHDYRKRFDFFGVAERIAAAQYATQFERAARETVGTAK